MHDPHIFTFSWSSTLYSHLFTNENSLRNNWIKISQLWRHVVYIYPLKRIIIKRRTFFEKLNFVNTSHTYTVKMTMIMIWKFRTWTWHENWKDWNERKKQNVRIEKISFLCDNNRILNWHLSSTSGVNISSLLLINICMWYDMIVRLNTYINCGK